jgi:hypothetical protein
MTYRSIEQNLVVRVGEKLAQEIGATPVKDIARDFRCSLGTATRLRRGDIRSASVLLTALNKLGAKLATRILEPVIGPLDAPTLFDRLADLDARLADLGDLRHEIARTRTALLARNPERMVDGAGRSAGEAGAALPQAGAPAPAQDGRTALGRQLAAFHGAMDLNEALSIARAAGNVSLAFRPANDPRWHLAYPARMNRLLPRDLVGRPYVEHPDTKYGRGAQADLEEAESLGSVFARVEAAVTWPKPIATVYEVVRQATHTLRGDRIIAAAALRLEAA